jgi:tetratricopeptide (TPR) repeat protein
MNRLAALALTFALVGCVSSSPAPAEAGRPLAAWWVEPAPADVAAFRGRFDALSAAPACQVELVRRAPEVAHAAFMGAPSEPLARALDGASVFANAPHAASEAARGAHPEEHARASALLERARASRAADVEEAARLAREAQAAFVAVADALRAGEAAALACALEPEDAPDEEVTPPSVALTTRWALARLGQARAQGLDAQTARVAQLVVAAQDATTLEHLEALFAVGALSRDGLQDLDWLRALATSALRRGHALQALRHALALSTAWTRDPRGPGHVDALRDRLLVGRAHLAAGEHEPALEEALAVIDATAALGPAAVAVEGSARALKGEVLLAMNRPDGALEAYAEAEDRFAQAGDQAAMWRQALNRAAASLRLSRAAEAQATLTRLAGPAPATGADATDLEVRRDVLVALAGVLASEATGEAAATKIDEALATARAAGALDVVERHAALPALLRAGPRSRPGPG